MTDHAAIKAARVAKGLTLRAAADLLGTSHSALLQIEAGARQPTLDWLYHAAVTLGVAPASFDSRLARRAVR